MKLKGRASMTTKSHNTKDAAAEVEAETATVTDADEKNTMTTPGDAPDRGHANANVHNDDAQQAEIGRIAGRATENGENMDMEGIAADHPTTVVTIGDEMTMRHVADRGRLF
jgi:hypothetical protein